MRAYDMTKARQDLRYLSWDEHTQPSGLTGTCPKAREGTGVNATFYKLCDEDRACDIHNQAPFNELVACRLMDILGIAHVKQHLVHARIKVQGHERDAWLLRSKCYREKGMQSAALELVFDAGQQQYETPLEFCLRQGWSHQVSTLLLVDFLIANRSRTGDNIEVVRKPDGTCELAPLYANARSLISSCCTTELSIERFDPLLDLDANNFLGSRSLVENLQFVDPAFEVQPLLPEHRELLFCGFRGILPKLYQDAMWDIIWGRWRAYARLRGL